VKIKRIIVASATAAAVVAGSAGAIAATNQDKGKQAEQAVLDDAAKRLNVAPAELRDALAKAQDAQLDQAVKDGTLTQQQADAIKARRKQDGRVLGGGGRGPGGAGRGFGHHGGGPGGLIDPAAKALGLSSQELATRLRAGKTLADIAKTENKDLADVKAAVKKAATEQLDAAVKAGRLTDAQRDAEVAELDEHIDRFAEGRGPGRFDRGHGDRGHDPRFGALPDAPNPPAEEEVYNG
jgi:hypothetical protein